MPDDNKFIIKSAELKTVCGVTSRIPATDLPEYVFAGKSNVGKSSLINVLMQRKSLARTSSQPGKTQTINYYLVNGEFFLVDLPGYGYTKAAAAARAEWGKMVERYLRQSRMIARIFLLVDMRHKPTADDKLMYDWIVSEGYTPVVIATKEDKLSKNERPKALSLIRDTLGLGDEGALITFSALKRTGREEICGLLH